MQGPRPRGARLPRPLQGRRPPPPPRPRQADEQPRRGGRQAAVRGVVVPRGGAGPGAARHGAALHPAQEGGLLVLPLPLHRVRPRHQPGPLDRGHARRRAGARRPLQPPPHGRRRRRRHGVHHARHRQARQPGERHAARPVPAPARQGPAEGGPQGGHHHGGRRRGPPVPHRLLRPIHLRRQHRVLARPTAGDQGSLQGPEVWWASLCDRPGLPDLLAVPLLRRHVDALPQGGRIHRVVQEGRVQGCQAEKDWTKVVPRCPKAWPHHGLLRHRRQERARRLSLGAWSQGGGCQQASESDHLPLPLPRRNDMCCILCSGAHLHVDKGPGRAKRHANLSEGNELHGREDSQRLNLAFSILDASCLFCINTSCFPGAIYFLHCCSCLW